MGRFLTKDPSKLETNLYLYSQANPINRIDPSGLFSKELIQKNVSFERFASSDNDTDHSKWGFYWLLLNAQNGDTINTAYVAPAWPGGPGGYYPPSESWSTPRSIYEVNCDKLMVGSQFLDEYYTQVVDKSWSPEIWWRDTTSVLYRIHRNGSTPKNIWDGFDNDTGTYPHFIGFSVGAVNYGEFGYLSDMYGNKYLSYGFGPSFTLGISYVEGYLCDWGLPSLNCGVGVPTASEMRQAIAGICGGPEALLILTGMDVGMLCNGFTNIDFTSSVAMYYVGMQFGGGVGATATIPLSWFGVPPNPRQSWNWLIDNRRIYGITWDSIPATME